MSISDALKNVNVRWNPLVTRRWGRYRDPVQLGRDHFRLRSEPDHVNAESMCNLLRLMGGAPRTILETGMSAWGTDSTRLFDAYVRSFGGRLWSVDIREQAIEQLRRHVSPATTLVCDDSAAFLREWVSQHPGQQADVVYFDSWDVDFAAPLPAAEHCIREIEAIAPALQPGSLLLVDDTPADIEDVPKAFQDVARHVHRDLGKWPGKGMLLDEWLAGCAVEKLYHRYQVLYRF